MKKLLGIFSALTLTSVSAANAIGCQEMPYYLNYITGVDTIVFTNTVTRDKKARRSISSNETDIIVNIDGANTGEFVVFALAKKMRLLWSFQDKNSIVFGTNNLLDYSTWDYIVPYNSRLDVAKKQAINFTDKYYKYVIVPIWAQTDIGEVLQVLDEDNKFYGFALNLNNFARNDRPKLDLSRLSSPVPLNVDITDVLKQLKPYEDRLNFSSAAMLGLSIAFNFSDEEQATIQAIVKNLIKTSVKAVLTNLITAGLKGQDVNIRVMAETAKSLSEVPQYEEDLGGLFHMFFEQYGPDPDHPGQQKQIFNTDFIPDKTHEDSSKLNVMSLLCQVHNDLAAENTTNISSYELRGEINKDLVSQIIQMESIDMVGKSSLTVNFINKGPKPGPGKK